MSDFQPFAESSGKKAGGPRGKGPPKRWLHPPSNLVSGSIIYAVKFWGSTEVTQPKGADVVKGAIERVKFQVHIKKQQGHKPPKVELCISAQALRTQDPKTKGILHQHPLSTISYCGDDKSNKSVFAYIAKGAGEPNHTCYIFATDRFADQITLTVGQAFDIAFKKFKADSGTDIDLKRRLMTMEKSMQEAEAEKHALRKRISELQMKKDMMDVETLKLQEQVSQAQTTNQFQSFEAELSQAQSAAMSSRPPAPLPQGNDLVSFDAPAAAVVAPAQAQPQLDWDPFASTPTVPAQQPPAPAANPAPQESSWATFESTPQQSAAPAAGSSWAAFDSTPAPVAAPTQPATFDPFGAAQPAQPAPAPAAAQPATFNPFGGIQPQQPAQPTMPLAQTQPAQPISPPAAAAPPQQSQWAAFESPAPTSPPAGQGQPFGQTPAQSAGHFQPFTQEQPAPSMQPVFGNVDAENLDSAIANIEQQLASLQDGFDTGFSLGPMSPTSPMSPPATGSDAGSLLQF